AVAGEARVQRAVRVVAGEREVGGARKARRDDLAVALERPPSRFVVAGEVGRLLAVAGEARVQRSVAVVAGEGEGVTTQAVAAEAADHDELAARIERHRVR